MSWRSDTAQWLPGSGWLSSAYPGFGITGAAMRAATATGDHGPGLLYNDWDSSADDAKEFRALVETPPVAGILDVREDGSFTFSGAPDGAYTLVYRLFVDGADLGTATASFTIGAASIALQASAQASGVASARLTTAIRLRASAVASGVASGRLSTAIRLRASAVASGVAAARLTAGGISLQASAMASGVASARLTTAIRLRASAVASGVARAVLTAGSGSPEPQVPPQRRLIALPGGETAFYAQDF